MEIPIGATVYIDVACDHKARGEKGVVLHAPSFGPAVTEVPTDSALVQIATGDVHIVPKRDLQWSIKIELEKDNGHVGLILMGQNPDGTFRGGSISSSYPRNYGYIGYDNSEIQHDLEYNNRVSVIMGMILRDGVNGVDVCTEEYRRSVLDMLLNAEKMRVEAKRAKGK
jgi:hypothetical protein